MLWFTLLIVMWTPADSLWNLIGQERYEQAVRFGESLVKEGRADRQTLLGLAYAYRTLDRLDDAVEIYQSILSANPRDVDALLGLALVLSWQGSLDSAIAVYQRVRQVDPGNREAWIGLIRTYGWAGRLQTAMTYADSALALFPDDPEVSQLAGDLRVWADRLEEAIPYFERAIQQAPERPELWIALAQTYEWLERFQKARETYRKALALDPENPKAQQGLQRIQKALGYEITLQADYTDEQDGTIAGDYRRVVVGVGKRGPWENLKWRIRVYGTRNQRGTEHNTWVLVAPELQYRLGRRWSLAGYTGWNPTHPSAYTLGWTLAYTAPLVRAHASYARDLLEPVRLVILQNAQFALDARVFGTQWKASVQWGTIPADTNTRRLLDLSLARDFPVFGITLKPMYSFGYMAYDHGSALYYSPDKILRHALGLGIFRTFGRAYLYMDYAQSVWTASGTPGTRNGSLEVGYGAWYLSVSYFATTEGYQAWTWKMGQTFQIPR